MTCRVFKGFLHVLKPAGFAEIRVPDIDQVLKTYVEKQLDILDVLYQSNAGPITVRDVIYGYGPEIEKTGVDFYAHKTGFTRKSLTSALQSAGFASAWMGTGRRFELVAFAFCNAPTAAHEELLKIKFNSKGIEDGGHPASTRD